MFNIMLDRLPEEWNRYRIRTDFRIGIQIAQCLNDTEFPSGERIIRAMELLFIDVPDTVEEAREGLTWFLTEFNHDNHPHQKKEEKPLMDYDRDQWRIYSAFLAQYHIDLNTAQMHWFVFMGLLSNLEECSHTRVMELRQREVDPKLPPKSRGQLLRMKQIYAIIPEETLAEKETEKEALEAFNRLRGSRERR